MVERGIGVEEVRAAVHVAADDPESDITVVITVYRPDPERWEPDFRKRRP
jgi:hypothetical protein